MKELVYNDGYVGVSAKWGWTYSCEHSRYDSPFFGPLNSTLLPSLLFRTCHKSVYCSFKPVINLVILFPTCHKLFIAPLNLSQICSLLFLNLSQICSLVIKVCTYRTLLFSLKRNPTLFILYTYLSLFTFLQTSINSKHCPFTDMYLFSHMHLLNLHQGNS